MKAVLSSSILFRLRSWCIRVSTDKHLQIMYQKIGIGITNKAYDTNVGKTLAGYYILLLAGLLASSLVRIIRMVL